MQIKTMYRGVKTARNTVSKTMRAMGIDNPYTDASGIGGKHHKNPNKPMMPERQDILTQIRQLEASIRKDQRRLANGLALRKPVTAGDVVKRIAGKRERILTLLDTLNNRLAEPAQPAPDPVHRPAKVRVEHAEKKRARWSKN